MAKHLIPEKREQFLEESFLLQMHLNMSYKEIRSLPLIYRSWFLKRLVKHYEEKSDSIEKSRNNKDTGKKQSLEETLSNVEKAKKYFDKLGK